MIAGVLGIVAAMVPVPALAAPPSLKIGNVTVIETDAAGVVAKATVRLSAPAGREVTVQFETHDGSAKSPADYGGKTGQVSFPAGAVQKTVRVPIKGDQLDEAIERFSIALENPIRATIGDGTGVVTIKDDDVPPTVSVGDGVEVVEGASSTSTQLDIPINFSDPSGRTMQVDWAVTHGTTSAGDAATPSGTATIPVGGAAPVLSVDVFGDDADETDETVIVTLSNPVHATIVDGTEPATILDDDGPSVSVTDDATIEGASHLFVVTLDAASQQDVVVSWATVDGTAVAGSDYTAATGTAQIDAGAVQTFFQVTNTEDATDEENESFTVELSDPVHATIDDGSGLGTIVDDDGPAMVVSDESRVEGWAETSNNLLTFDVTLSAPSPQTVSVDWETVNGTASAPSDFDADSGTVTFAPNDTTESFTVEVNGDLTEESGPDEQFTVVLSDPSNGTISDGTGTGTIDDDDCAGSDETFGGGAIGLPDVRGDSGSDSVVVNDAICTGDVDWYQIDMTESSNSSEYLAAQVTVEMNAAPAQTTGDLELHVFRQDGTTLVASSDEAGTATEQVEVRKDDTFDDDTTTLALRVGPVGGAVNSYTLTVVGNVDVDTANL